MSYGNDMVSYCLEKLCKVWDASWACVGCRIFVAVIIAMNH